MSTTPRPAFIPVSALTGPVLTLEEAGLETDPETGLKTGLRLREAALRLGITEKTLRKRIQEGDIRAWTVEGQRGLEWRVAVPEGRPPVNEHESSRRLRVAEDR